MTWSALTNESGDAVIRVRPDGFVADRQEVRDATPMPRSGR